MKNSPKRVLVLAPHTDDAELGCGGTLSRFIEEGSEIFVAAFSTAEESLPPGSPRGLLRGEFLAAMNSMTIPESNTRVFDFPVRRLSYHRQEVLEELVKLRKEIDPEMVFLPSGNDLHQDHQVVHGEGLRVFKERNTWAYELPWNQIEFTAQAFVTLQRKNLNVKWEALQAYKSQLELHRPYFSWTFVEGLARVRGVQVKAEYAEAFEVIRVRW
jgi:LmbE family N-acetylglucosaminyl deacetylase